MLYFIIRPITYLGLLVFCRKIYLSNTKSIPKDRPVILACNHPTAFLEPSVVASFLSHPLYFLVRGDFFSTSFYRKLMLSLHLIPIYNRNKANFKELKKNVSLMSEIKRKLNENITLMILVEGSASVKKGLRPIQKGVARLAFDTYEKYGRADLEIIPVGANFDDPTHCRMTPMIHLGEALLLKNYLELYKEHKNKGIQALMNDIQAGMRRNIIHVEEETDEILVEQQLKIYRSDQKTTRFPILNRSPERLRAEINITESINRMPSVEKELLRTKSRTYFNQLLALKLKDKYVGQKRIWWQIPFLVLGFPFFLVGLLLNGLAPFFAYRIGNKRVKRIQYLMPVIWAIATFSYLPYWLILFFIAAFFGTISLMLFVCCLPILGYFSIIYAETFEAWQGIRTWRNLGKDKQRKLMQLRMNAIILFQK